MIEPIVIKVVDKVPIVVSGPQYVVCDNSDYTVVWQLDEEWAQFEHRTMQVNYKDGTYERVLFTGSSCTLPAIPVSGPVHVGLFAGDIHTTRPARLLAVRSATTDSGEERDPAVIPAWQQPDSTNPYMTGDKVTHGGKTWRSTCDNNVWEPGVYGWEEVTT